MPLLRYKNRYHSALCISRSLFTQARYEAGLRYPRARKPCENGYYFFTVRFPVLSRLVQENGDKWDWNRCGDNHDSRRHAYRWGSKLGTAGDPIFLVMMTQATHFRFINSDLKKLIDTFRCLKLYNLFTSTLI